MDSTNPSIQEGSFLDNAPAALVPGGVAAEPVRVRSCIIMPFVPTYFTVVWDSEGAAVAEWDWLDERGEEGVEDFVFEVLGVLEGEGIVIVHHHADVGKVTPHMQHRLVDDPG